MEEKVDEVLLQENRNLQILQRSLAGALKDVFGEYSESQRFLDLKQIPLICKDISTINKNIDDIKKAIEKKEDDYETRLRKIEAKQAYWAGAAGLLGAIGGWVIQHFVK